MLSSGEGVCCSTPRHNTMSKDAGAKGRAASKLFPASSELTTERSSPTERSSLRTGCRGYGRPWPGPHLPIYFGVLSDAFKAGLQGYTTPKDGYQPIFTSAYMAK